MNEWDEGLKWLKKQAEDLRNWQSGFLQAEKLYELGKQADHRLRNQSREEADLKENIARYSAEETALRKSVQLLQKEVGGWKSDLGEKERIKADRLSELDGQIEAKAQRLAELMAKLEDVRVRVSV